MASVHILTARAKVGLARKALLYQIGCSFGRRGVAKDVRFGQPIREALMKGLNIVANAVAVTMGPKGRNVIVEQDSGKPRITKDGYSVAKAITLPSRLENMGASVLVSIATKTNEDSGDGTSSAMIVGRAIAEGTTKATAGNRVELRKGIALAADTIEAELKRMAKPVNTSESIENIATISANGDRTIGSCIAHAFQKVGLEGTITIKDSSSMKDSVEVLPGYGFDSGYLSPFFCDKAGKKLVLEDSLLLLTTANVRTMSTILPVLEHAFARKKPIAIVASDFSADVIQTLVMNKLRIGLRSVAIKAPGFGDMRDGMLKDMAAATGSVLIDDEVEVKLSPEKCGRCKEITVTKDSTIILNDGNKINKLEVERRANILRDLIKNTRGVLRAGNYRERLARLLCGVALINVGGVSEVDVSERKDRTIDSLNATRSAIESGIVPGGGIALLRCIPALRALTPENSDQAKGIEIVMEAVKAPSSVLLSNGGYPASVIINKIMEIPDRNIGFDVCSGKYVNMIDEGIIDALSVVEGGVRDASGAAAMLATVEAAITKSTPF